MQEPAAVSHDAALGAVCCTQARPCSIAHHRVASADALARTMPVAGYNGRSRAASLRHLHGACQAAWVFKRWARGPLGDGYQNQSAYLRLCEQWNAPEGADLLQAPAAHVLQEPADAHEPDVLRDGDGAGSWTA